MKKKDILTKLKEISIDKSQFVIMDDASIVYHGIKRDCDTLEIESLIDFSCEGVTVHKSNCPNILDKNEKLLIIANINPR